MSVSVIPRCARETYEALQEARALANRVMDANIGPLSERARDLIGTLNSLSTESVDSPVTHGRDEGESSAVDSNQAMAADEVCSTCQGWQQIRDGILWIDCPDCGVE